MDRNFAYSGAIPLDTDLMATNQNAYFGLAKLAGAVLGTSNLVNNATCTQQSPASLNVIVGPCEIYSLQTCDSSAYGDLGTNSNQIVKQGVNLSNTVLALTAPGTAGYSQNYLIQFGFQEVDGKSIVLEYYNPTNPSSPYSGPNNTGAANNTVRQDQVLIQAKAGVAAPTGTQTTPSPDTGFVGGFVVTVANGQTQITNANISAYLTSNPNFINETLIQKISQTTADGRYSQKTQVQNSAFTYGLDTSVTPNTLTVSLSPALTSYIAGQTFKIVPNNTNTGASTININGLGAINILRGDGTALLAGDILAHYALNLYFDGTEFLIQGINTWQFGKSLASSGYQKLPSGVIIQWGITQSVTVSLVNTIYSGSITLPLAFPNNFYQVIICDSGGGDYIWSSQMSSNSTFNAFVMSSINTGSPQGRYIAIGN